MAAVGECDALTVEDFEKKLAQLVVRAPVAVAMQRGPELVYELANPAYRGLLGGRELIGRKVRDVLPEDASLIGILEQVYARGEPFAAKEFPFRIDPTGQGRWELGYFNVLCEPTRDGVLTFGVEVTEHVVARQRVERLVEDLEQAVRVRDDFLSIASHELRTPLTPLQLQAHLLRRAFARGALAPAEALGRLAMIDRSVERLTVLVDTLLDVSRLAAGRVDLSRAEVDLAELAREVVARMRHAVEVSGSAVTVLASDPVAGRWDRTRLAQIVTNLLSNALKYGAGAPVEVRVERIGPTARLRVRDQGIGIAAEHHQRIFERFERAVPARSYSGFGVGLWVVKLLVEALGGTVAVDSAPGAGATFTVELPLQVA